MNQYRTGGAGYYAASYGVEVIQPRQQAGAVAGDAWYTAGGAPAPVAAYQAIGAADLAASFVNLANPGVHDAFPGIAPAFDVATGWIFNGATSQRNLRTDVVPAVGWSVIVRFSDATANGYVTGMTSGGNTRFYLNPNYNNVNNLYGYSGTFQSGSPVVTGTIGMAANTCYANGVAVGTSPGSTIGTHPIWIGLLNIAGSGGGPFNGKIQALAIYDATLDAAMVAAVHAAMMALA